MSPAAARATRTTNAKRDGRSPLEWALLVTASAAITALIAALVAGGVNAPKGAPDVRITVGEASIDSRGVTYQVHASNRGGEVAENVEIEVTVGQETRTLVITAIGERDRENGTVIFPPGTVGSPKAEVQSYGVRGR